MKFEGASRFPTRNFPYHRNASGLSRDGLADPLKDTPTGAAARFILGIDRKASVLEPRAEASPVNDAFAKLVLAPGHRPETLLELLAVLDAVVGPDALPDQRIYRVADGGQIAWDPSTADLDLPFEAGCDTAPRTRCRDIRIDGASFQFQRHLFTGFCLGSGRRRL
ncbi:hypothetical protein [Rhizobium lentis]|uniref:hypothetical protein n=1 Tax=Rhizobium lentis TaxID=1138194 RepID=UPI001C831F59|nr:hypothetical protein [Rhizobium lentis]MBX5116508.1 hypothetical protein [Rhizobium lentis]